MIMNDNKFSTGYYRTSFDAASEMEGSGSSGRNAADVTVSENFDGSSRKCISLNSQMRDAFGVPTQFLSLSRISSTERKALIRRLKLELEQVRAFQKRIDVPRTNGVTVSSSSDILSCSNGNNGENLRKSSAMNSKSGKKGNASSKSKGWNRGSSGKFEPVNKVLANTSNVMLMKQCEALLKRLMKHEYGWVFNTPVDVVQLKIPDYLNIIKHPMDLGTILRKISSAAYASPLEFLDDVRLTFRNAMEYNPPGHDVYAMADTMSKFFEVRWKNIEKKFLKADVQDLPAKSSSHGVVDPPKMSPIKKRKISSFEQENVPEPVKHVITEEERHKLGRELESLLAEMPMHIVDFLKEHSSNGNNAEDDEIEIDIDDLSDDTLIKLRKLLDDYLQEKQKNQASGEQCEIEVLNESGPSNSSMPHHKGNDMGDEDVDIGGNEAPVSSYPPVEIETVEIEKDASPKRSKVRNSHGSGDLDIGSSSENESENAKPPSPSKPSEVPEILDSEAQGVNKTGAENTLEGNQSGSGLDHVDQTSLQKPSSVELDGPQDGDSARSNRQVSPDKLYRFAQVKNRFLDTILKAREKTLSQDNKGIPEKKREELELQKMKAKAKMQADLKAAEEVRRQADAAAAAEARRKRELEREAARQALLQMEKTVDIYENPRLLEDLEMLRNVPGEPVPSSVDESSPDHSQDGLPGFKFGGGSNPLEQLGLFMKDDEDEEEGENHHLNFSNPPQNDVEEGEID